MVYLQIFGATFSRFQSWSSPEKQDEVLFNTWKHLALATEMKFLRILFRNTDCCIVVNVIFSAYQLR